MCVQAMEAVGVNPRNHDLVGAMHGHAETILYVEDEIFVRDVTREVLRSAGYSVLAARNAVEALAAYGEHHGQVDLLLTDVILPGETGRVLASRLRQQNPSLAVLLVSGYAEQIAAHQSGQSAGEAAGPTAGPTECMAKPFSTSVLLLKIRELLGERRAWSQRQSQEGSAIRHVSGNA